MKADVTDFKAAVEDASQELLKQEQRTHLGASEIGGKCARQAWYSFRWFGGKDFEGRMLRLFQRGHDEEHRIIRWLRAAGCEVQDYAERLIYNHAGCCYEAIPWDASYFGDNPDLQDCSDSPAHITLALAAGVKLKQWGFAVDVGEPIEGLFDPRTGEPCEPRPGHYSGSSDGRIRGVGEWLPEVAHMGWGLLECKTGNDKAYKELNRAGAKGGVLANKPGYYVQMQQYMKFMGLRWALFILVNKNDDSIYYEVVFYKEEVSEPYAKRALAIIGAQQAPGKLTQDPSWFECNFCDFKENCHYDKAAVVNCRSCVYAEPVAGKAWRCNKFQQVVPGDFIPQGCAEWEEIK